MTWLHSHQVDNRSTLSAETLKQQLDQENSDLRAFHQFMVNYDRTYATHEKFNERFAVFKENLRYIESMNEKRLSYRLGINEFADWTDEEFMDTYARPQEAPVTVPTKRRSLQGLDYTSEVVHEKTRRYSRRSPQ